MKMMNLKSAIDKFNREEYIDCISVIKKYADDGVPEAEAYLGLAYQFGLAVEIDIAKAIVLMEKAANSGLGLAAHNLATLYVTHTDRPEMGRVWYKKAQALGFKVSTD